MFFSAPPAAAPPAIQRLPPALAAATSSLSAVPSLEAALAAALSAATATKAAASHKITVSFFNEEKYSSASLPAASYSGFEVEDAGNGYDEAFLRGIAVASGEQKQRQMKLLLLHPLSSLASSASPSLPLTLSITSRPRGGFETCVAEYRGGELARIRLQPPPGRARPGARVRVSAALPSSFFLPSSASVQTSPAASTSSYSSSSSLLDVVLAFALARKDVSFTAVDARTSKVLLKSEGNCNRNDDDSGDKNDVTSLILRALGGSSVSSPPSSSVLVSYKSVTTRLWALVPPEGEIVSSSKSSFLRRRFVSVDGRPLEAPLLEAELDRLFAEICAGLSGERRRGGGSGGSGRSGGIVKRDGAAAAARRAARRVPAFVLKLSTTTTTTTTAAAASATAAAAAVKASSDFGDAAPFCGRMGLPLLLSLGGTSGKLQEAAARRCVREAALRCWKAAAPARLLAGPLLAGLPPPPRTSPPQQGEREENGLLFEPLKRARKDFATTSNAAAFAAAAHSRALRSAPAVLISSSAGAAAAASSSLDSFSFHPRFASAAAASSSQHPESILTLEQLAGGARSLAVPRAFDDWGSLSSSSNSSSASKGVRPLSQLTAVDGKGSPIFLVAVVDQMGRQLQEQLQPKQRRQQLLVAFDPHAAHERVRLELLTESYLTAGSGGTGGGDAGSSSSDSAYASASSLPLPRPCELRLRANGDDAEAVRRHAAGLARWGWRWRSSVAAEEKEKGEGEREDEGDVVVVCLTHAAAVAGARLSAADFIDHARALLLSASSSSSSSASSTLAAQPPPAAPRALASRACRGAYMFSARHRLSGPEASSLLDSLSRSVSPRICAHGRPTASPLADLGKVRAMVKARREARRRSGGGEGGGEEMKMTTATADSRAAASSSLSALVASLRSKVSRVEKERIDQKKKIA